MWISIYARGFGDIRCLNVSWVCDAHFASLLQTWLQLVEATPQSAFETNLLYSGLLLLPRHRQARSLQRNHKACALFCNTMGPPIQRNSKRPCIRTPGFQWFSSMLFYQMRRGSVWRTHRTTNPMPNSSILSENIVRTTKNIVRTIKKHSRDYVFTSFWGVGRALFFNPFLVGARQRLDRQMLCGGFKIGWGSFWLLLD